MESQTPIESLSAVTLAVGNMARAVAFYETLGFELRYGGPGASFTSFHIGASFLNLTSEHPPAGWWGRLIVHVADVDAMYERVQAAGLTAEFPPTDAEWGERYFHLLDPDGHEVSLARPIEPERQ